ncbi:uncharacterized protein LOC115443658 isoform X1 [Manduca sexta]|uniref:uncharacterized protein LOC115443658 isoform X1 n=1 Tax=Manduca sexta TaxID=7130 RepID=UPI00188EFBBD|nr:uncharacterized protein LOC115443658 isoform X1 [Manduca sexta]
MSFIDLATLTTHRRNELECRIKQFSEKCDHAINEIEKLKAKSQGFVLQLNCDPNELKERFLSSMKILDEYTYVITDFNLAVGKLEETGSMDYTPVHDRTLAILPAPPVPPFNLLDALSEPTPSTSNAPTKLYPPEKPKRMKTPKEDQLIVFSSASCSSESVPQVKQEVATKEIQCEITDEMKNMSLNASTSTVERINLPAQSILEVDQTINGTIMYVDGAYFWVITEDVDKVYSINNFCRLMTEMTEYYSENQINLSAEEVKSLPYVAFYDDECYYRGLFLGITEDKEPTVEVFVVDTGERRRVSLSHVHPLEPRFCTSPPFARCCHLAGIDLQSYQNENIVDAFEDFTKNYIGTICVIHVDDNTSESLGVYVILPDKKTLNEIIITEGLGYAIDKEEVTPEVNKEPDSANVNLDPELDISQCPEYDDPVEAVTGYHNRDEADICKHYKGGPAKTCYKGTKCTKRHVVKHPDGWTLDRVEVVAKCKSLPLPEPGTWHKLLVTYVCHFDRLYVQFVHDDEKEEDIPEFGVILPPTTLTSLIKDMNSPATRMNYKPLTISPAPGELVAALYPMDGNWYRARVLSVTRADQNVEVQYIDYGTILWVKEDQIKVLEARYQWLPMQALRCVLAGVRARGRDSQLWGAARRALTDRAFNRALDAHVVARDYDEITVELFDEEGYSIAEQLAAQKLIDLVEYEVIPDKNVQQKMVVP